MVIGLRSECIRILRETFFEHVEAVAESSKVWKTLTVVRSSKCHVTLFTINEIKCVCMQPSVCVSAVEGTEPQQCKVVRRSVC